MNTTDQTTATNAEIRAWARETPEFSDRLGNSGPIPKGIRAAYEAAHEAADIEETATHTITGEIKRDSHPCRCGCGAQTLTPQARYIPGHDARHVSVLISRFMDDLQHAELATNDSKARDRMDHYARQLTSPALQLKFTNAISRRVHSLHNKWADKYNAGKAEKDDAPITWHPDELY